MIQALFVHDIILDPNPAWWPLLYPADILIGFYLSRIFAARMLTIDNSTESWKGTDHETRAMVGVLSFVGAVFWIPGLVVWGLTKSTGGLQKQWVRSVEKKSQRLIAQRQGEAPAHRLPRLRDRNAA